MSLINKKYEELLAKHGKQGWWPLLDINGCNPTKTGSHRGYHPGDYSYPKNKRQRFEICIGAILTQNTSWTNVEKALTNLYEINSLKPESIVAMETEKLRQAIRPSGYFNQKAKKLKVFAKFFQNLKGNPTRNELLQLWGIGPETADSILLYAYKVPVFVVDAYTRRIFSGLMIDSKDKYEKIRQLFEENLPKDYKILQEYHALIVEEGKNLPPNNS